MADMTAPEVAQRLGYTRRHVVELLNTGVLGGRRLASGAWIVDSDVVLRHEAAARRGKGRTLAVATAWGLLWELSGLGADWLTPSTRSRVRARLRDADADAEEIARAVSARTRAHRFRAANVKTAAADLIATGPAVAGSLDVGLMDDARRVSGYVRQGSVAAYAKAHFLLPSDRGQDVLYENTLPVAFSGDIMPPAVIAADLAVSTDTRERAGGIRELDRLRRAWLAAN